MKSKITKREVLFFFLGALTVGLVNLFFYKNENGKSFKDYFRNTRDRNRVI